MLRVQNPATDTEKTAYLAALGDQVRALRARRGLTRKALAQAAQVSLRHLANLEGGTGNTSVLFLRQIAAALDCSVAELTGDEGASSPEWLLIRAMLAGQNDAVLQTVRKAVAAALQAPGAAPSAQRDTIALIGLRGAGKSTLGAALAAALDRPFVELSQHIEKLAGCSTTEIQALYGMTAYRRYEARALLLAMDGPAAVIATPGGIVSDSGSFNTILTRCRTVWLRASPEDHMKRVIAQGDKRPMAASREAMQDLKNILDSRSAFYAKADWQLDTSAQNQASCLQALVAWATEA
jgi:XRE family transcriptional regulator, aerobic/anaerobic benzoate catabolism transcriptional regulator